MWNSTVASLYPSQLSPSNQHGKDTVPKGNVLVQYIFFISTQQNLVGHFLSFNISSCFVEILNCPYYFNGHSERAYTVIYLTVYLLSGS